MEDQINEEEALSLIRGTIEDTKESIKEKGWIYVILGGILIITSVINFIQLNQHLDNSTGVMYTGIFLTSVVALGYNWFKYGLQRFNARSMKNKPTSTPLESMWAATGWIMLAIMISSEQNTKVVYPILIMTIGMLGTISGGNLMSSPFGLAAFIVFFIGLISYRFGLPYQLLLIALSAFISLLIPGIMLVRSKKKPL